MKKRQSSSRKSASATRKKSGRSTSKAVTRRNRLLPLLFFLILVLVGGAGWFGYELGIKKSSEACRRKVADYCSDLEKVRARLAKLESQKNLQEKEACHPPKHRKIPPPPKTIEAPSEIRDYLSAGGSHKPLKSVAPLTKKAPSVTSRKPELAIIIDDVAFPSQLRAIRSLPWHITPSLFPPSSRHPETARMARGLRHYMIHLPMEALHYNHPETVTLLTNDTTAQIKSRLADLRRWFPDAHFINNHTGSRFTSDMAAMSRFYPIAKAYGFHFVDSRTTPKTVVPEICKRYGDPYIARNVFLDNEENVTYVQNQLKEAVKLARAHGYAIAIGHPHEATLKALARSGKILKGVKLLYIDELYDKIKR